MNKITRYLLVLPVLSGITCLIGWAFALDMLKRPFGQLIAMNPMTALCLVLSSAAIFCLFSRTPRRTPGLLLAGIPGLVGLLKLSEAYGLPTDIDDLLFHSQMVMENNIGLINRMAPNSAFNFTLIALALLLGHMRYSAARTVAVWLALCVFVVGEFSFVSHVYRVREHYGILNYLPMAVHTALSFVCIALALLYEYRDRAFMRVFHSPYTGGRISRVLVPVAIFAPMILGYIRLYISWQIPLGVELGVAMLTTSIIIVFLIVVWFVSRALNLTDAARRDALLKLQQQAALFELMPDAVIYGTRELSITSMNAAAEQIFDIAADKALGRKVDDIIRIEMVGVSREAARVDLWGDKGFWKGEITLTTLTGRKINALLTLKANPGDGVSERGFIGIFTDITEFKQSQDRLEFVMSSMRAGLWEWNFHTGKRWWSPAYFELLGYTYNELEPSEDSLRQIMHPDDVEYALKTMAAHRYRTDRFDIEVRMLHKDGSYRWFQSIGKVRMDGTGQPMTFIGSIVDIDERVQARLLMEQQSNLIASVPDAIISGTLENRILSLNAGAEEMLGMTSAEAIGKTLDEIATLKVTGMSREAARQEFAENNYLRTEIEITNKAGDKYYLLCTARRYAQMQNGQPGWISLYTDISPLRINDQLRAANRYLEQLAFLAAHDIKAPVQTLGGLTGLLLKSPTLAEQDRSIITMQNDVIEQMKRTNRGLNDILKLRQGLQEDIAALERVSFQTIMDSVRTTLAQEVDASGAKLVIELGNAADVMVPYLHMQSVMQNLISNAIKYRDQTRPLIIQVQATQAGDEMTISVEDNGMGMNLSRYGDKLFGMFKRFHPGVEGTGIGLNIVKSIIEAYGGSIIVKSAVNEGTTFEILLPIL